MKEITLGVDIGGTNSVFGLVNKEGEVLFSEKLRTTDYDDPREFVKFIANNIEDKLNTQFKTFQLKGIGIGAPNGNIIQGTIEYPPNLRWKGIIPLSDYFKDHFNLPVVLTNDANAAAIGEMMFGGAKGLKDFVILTLGTGLGSGLVVNGDLVYGHDGFAGELGHTMVYFDKGRQCACGQKGCLETYVSANGIRRTLFELLSERLDDSQLRNVTFNEMTSEDIYKAASQGDTIAREAFELTGKILGAKLADTIAHISPQAIFFYGGLANAGDLILKPTKYYMEHYLMNTFKNKVDLYLSSLNDTDGAMVGAAAMPWKEI
ncbi:MAG: ROK family protein [Bacteroidota bacterium]